MTEQGVFARFRSGKTVMSFIAPVYGTKRVVVSAPLNDAVFDDIRTAVDEAEKSYRGEPVSDDEDTIVLLQWKIDLLQWLLAEKTHIINTVFAAGNTVTITNLPGKDARAIPPSWPIPPGGITPQRPSCVATAGGPVRSITTQRWTMLKSPHFRWPLSLPTRRTCTCG